MQTRSHRFENQQSKGQRSFCEWDGSRNGNYSIFSKTDNDTHKLLKVHTDAATQDLYTTFIATWPMTGKWTYNAAQLKEMVWRAGLSTQSKPRSLSVARSRARVDIPVWCESTGSCRRTGEETFSLIFTLVDDKIELLYHGKHLPGMTSSAKRYCD